MYLKNKLKNSISEYHVFCTIRPTINEWSTFELMTYMRLTELCVALNTTIESEISPSDFTYCVRSNSKRYCNTLHVSHFLVLTILAFQPLIQTLLGLR